MSEQVKLLRTYNQWRRGEIEGSMDDLGLHPADIGKAIDSVLDDYATLQAEYEEELFCVRQTRDSHFGGMMRAIEQVDALQAECERLTEALQNANQSSGAEAYDIACEELEAYQRKRVAQGKDAGTEFSLVDGMSSVFSMLDKSEAERDLLRAELAAIKEKIRHVEIEYPLFNHEAMGCGLEDRGITNVYEAMNYGYEEALVHMTYVINNLLLTVRGE